MADFLASDNVCGQNLLQIVSIGNAIISELLRLKDYIPKMFLMKTKEDQVKYAEIIFDFRYFKISEVQNKRIEENTVLQDLDDDIRVNYLDILTRFYLAFESIHKYIVDLNGFINELNDGLHIQQSVESVLQDEEGKQLLCESLYLYGVMLLITDLHIPGVVRERLIVSYHRYNSFQNQHTNSNIDDVCKLLRSTGFQNLSDPKRVIGYPEEYFQRMQIDTVFIEMVIGRLRTDDIYNQITVYPLPEHRTTALGNQASMLFVCLFFSPETLHRQTSRMREIVDKFFADNWIASIYMGITINLIDIWEPYKAANQALLNTIDPTNITYYGNKYAQNMEQLLPKLRQVLKEGSLTDQIVLKNTSKIINLLRDCNVCLRWLILHTSQPVFRTNSSTKRLQAIQQQVMADSRYKPNEVFELLLNTSQLELKVRDIIREMLDEKERKWLDLRQGQYERIMELAEVFSADGTRLIRIDANRNLQKWFIDIGKEIEGLKFNMPTVSGRKLIQLIQALEEVQEFHNLDANMQVKQHLIETRQHLHMMIQTMNIKEETLINLQMIGDLSYAWINIDTYTEIMQESIKKQPNLVTKLRATFLKLASALEIPLLRINQSHSEDLVSVSQYYSNELINYVRKVVQIIPETMFDVLTQIIHIQTDVLKEIPTRLEKDRLKEYAQLDERYQIARLTYSMSVFTEGILMMKTTLVGVIELDPKQLLEDGIRKELVKHVSRTLHEQLTFSAKPSKNTSELEQRTLMIAKIIDGYRRSFEYVQDYLNISGLRIWQEEISRIINYNVEKECNTFSRRKIQDWQSEYQTDAIPIPIYPVTDNKSVNFIGRLAREILRQTDPKSTIFVNLSDSWFDYKTQKDIFHFGFFGQIVESIGPAMLVGLDRLYSHMIYSDLHLLIGKVFYKNVFKEKNWIEILDQFKTELQSAKDKQIATLRSSKLMENSTPTSVSKLYNSCIGKFSKLWVQMLDLCMQIGQKQILRRQIAYKLNTSCKFNSKNLESSVRAMNEALLIDVKKFQLDSSHAMPDLSLLHEVNTFLEWVGIYDPYQKCYIATKSSSYYPLVLMLFVVNNLSKFQYQKTLGCLTAKKSSDHIDGFPFVVGVWTILKQLHSDLTDHFIEHLCQYCLFLCEYYLRSKKEFGIDVQNVIRFLELFVEVADLPNDIVVKYIPEVILNQREYLAMKI